MDTSAARTAPAAFPRAEKPVWHWRRGSLEAVSLPVICEAQVAIVVNGRSLATLLCSASSVRELAYGFLYNEGVIGTASEVVSFAHDEGRGTVELAVARPVEPPAAPVRSTGFGGAALAAWERPLGCTAGLPAAPAAQLLSQIAEAMRRMQAGAAEYASTRGMHCSALWDDGAIHAQFEDVGRHNTLDKLAGCCLLEGIDARGCLLVTTGRVSAEMIRKAQRMGVGAVASLSGPTDAAVDLARAGGTLLAGYVHDDAATVYACPDAGRRARGNLMLV